VLQKAMDAACFGASCSKLKTQSFADANKCAVPDTVKEPVDGCKFMPPSARSTRDLKSNSLFPLGISKLPGM
jgi:hypothetical protein